MKLVRELAAIFSGRGLQLLVALPPEHAAYDYAGLAAAADALILMSYDEHTEKGVQGPLASQGWFETFLPGTSRIFPADKLIVSIGSYGYDWENGQAGPGNLRAGGLGASGRITRKTELRQRIAEPDLQLSSMTAAKRSTRSGISTR